MPHAPIRDRMPTTPLSPQTASNANPTRPRPPGRLAHAARRPGAARVLLDARRLALAAPPAARRRPSGDGLPGHGRERRHDLAAAPLPAQPRLRHPGLGPGLQLRAAPRRARALRRRHPRSSPTATASRSACSAGAWAASTRARWPRSFPTLTRCVITLGTPFTGHPRATNAWRVYEWLSGSRVGDAELMAAAAGGRRRCRRPRSSRAATASSPGAAASTSPARWSRTSRSPASHVGMGMNPTRALRRRRPPGAADRPVAAVRRVAAHGAGSSAPARPRRRRPPRPRLARSAPPLMQISANGIALEVEDHGSPQGEPLLLIMGLGMQLLGWHEDFVAAAGGARLSRDPLRQPRHRPQPDASTSRRAEPRARLAALRARPARRRARTRSATWPPTRSACSTRSASQRRTSAARRWAA